MADDTLAAGLLTKKKKKRSPIGGVLDLINDATGWNAFNNLVGTAQAATRVGIPDRIEAGPDGSLVVRSSKVDSPEALGSDIILAPNDADAVEMAHESRHLDQNRTLGPLMIAAKPIEALHDYGSGPLERDAYRNETDNPTTEFLRRKPNQYTSLVEALLQKMLR